VSDLPAIGSVRYGLRSTALRVFLERAWRARSLWPATSAGYADLADQADRNPAHKKPRKPGAFLDLDAVPRRRDVCPVDTYSDQMHSPSAL